MKDFNNCDPSVAGYVFETFYNQRNVHNKLEQMALTAGLPNIQVGQMDARHLQVIARLMQARKMVEIGTLGGFSGSALLNGAGPFAHLWTFEVEPKHAKVAEQVFADQGRTEQVDIILGKAMERLRDIEKHGPFDLVFIDADKENYPNYLDWAYNNLRLGGVVIGDNTFAFNEIALPHRQENPSVRAIRKFNDVIANSGRFLGTVIPTGEGLTIGVKI